MWLIRAALRRPVTVLVAVVALALTAGFAVNRMRADIITALGSIDGVAYASASAGQRNTWLTNNTDRVLFGTLLFITVGVVMFELLRHVEDRFAPWRRDTTVAA